MVPAILVNTAHTYYGRCVLCKASHQDGAFIKALQVYEHVLQALNSTEAAVVGIAAA